MKRKNNSIFFFPLFILALLLSQSSCAQLTKEDRLDSLKAGFMRDSVRIFKEKEINLLIGLDGRSSFYRKTPIDVQGIQLGISSGRMSMGMGFYKVLQGYQASSNKEGNINTVDSIKIGFYTVFFEYSFIDTKWWEIGLLTEAGGGKQTSIHNVYSPHMKVLTSDTGTFVHAALGVDVNFNLFYWVSLNVLAGYRLALSGDPNVNFNGPYFSYGLAWHFGEVIRRFKLHEKRGAYYHNVSMVNDPPPWN